jgi:hypothetical protein
MQELKYPDKVRGASCFYNNYGYYRRPEKNTVSEYRSSQQFKKKVNRGWQEDPQD